MNLLQAERLTAGLLAAQQQTSIVVTGTAEPIPLAEGDRDVRSLPLPEKQSELYNSWFDLIALDPALDLQARAAGAMRAELSIRGATFGPRRSCSSTACASTISRPATSTSTSASLSK